MKPQILLRTSLASLNHLHLHHNHNQMVSRFSQFPFRSIATTFHLPINRRHSGPTPPLFRPNPLNMCSLASPNPPPPDPSLSKTTVKVVIAGRVQRVRYRDWTVENATELGLKGWVRNRGDGCVEALFSGDADKVEEMQERCRTGPACAIITKLTVNPSTEDPGSGFERRESF